MLLDREATLAKVVTRIDEAAAAGCRLVAFGESLVPGYPVWLSSGHGARFDCPVQKAIHARYLEQAVQPEAGHLDEVCAAAQRGGIAVVLGIAERAADRGGHSLYCTCVYIAADGEIQSTHRKLVPTYEERLAWAIGDGEGLVVHALEPFTVGALNCWENWLPLPRAALHAQGENLHVAIWPGGDRNTRDITRFLAIEGRSFVLSASSLLRACDVPVDFPHRDTFVRDEAHCFMNGGSAAAAPDGSWLVEPVIDREELITFELDRELVDRERQNMDLSGHYARPDVLRLTVDPRRVVGRVAVRGGAPRPTGANRLTRAPSTR